MPNIYRALVNGLAISPLPSEFRQVPGGAIMTAMRPPGDMRALFDADN